MKAYKYHRYSDGPRISMQFLGMNEEVIYIPELKRVLYNSHDGYHMKDYFGVCIAGSESEEQIIKEAEEYVRDVKNGIIPAQVPETDIGTLPAHALQVATAYSLTTGIPIRASQQRFYIKRMESKKEEKRTSPLSTSTIYIAPPAYDAYLYGYEELNLEITLEDIQKIENNVKQLKEIELSQKTFQNQFFK